MTIYAESMLNDISMAIKSMSLFDFLITIQANFVLALEDRTTFGAADSIRLNVVDRVNIGRIKPCRH